MSKNILIMGVSGSGKSTIGKMLAYELNMPFFDADTFHSEANKKKMESGIPLTDLDRIDWLENLNSILVAHRRKNCVLACSALKESYRQLLKKNNNLDIIYLKISKQTVKSRLEQRKNHFMPASLIDSQFEALEEPNDVTAIEATNAPRAIISEILHRLGYEY